MPVLSETLISARRTGARCDSVMVRKVLKGEVKGLEEVVLTQFFAQRTSVEA